MSGIGWHDGTAKATAQPLPEARRLRRALESLGATTHTRPGTRNPHGERGDAAQLTGALRAILEQVETGLRGGPLQTEFQKGWMAGYDRDISAILAAMSERSTDLAAFAGQGITKAPLASRQLSTAVCAALVSVRAFSAAAEVVAGTDEALTAAEKLSENMIRNAHELARYIERLETESGPVTGPGDVSIAEMT